MSVIRSVGRWACQRCTPKADVPVRPVWLRAAQLTSVFSAAGGSQRRRGGILSLYGSSSSAQLGKWLRFLWERNGWEEGVVGGEKRRGVPLGIPSA